MRWNQIALATATVIVASAAPAIAQRDDAAVIATQKAAMDKLAWMDGTWRGPGSTQAATGAYRVTQTERIGPMLDGTIRVLEGKGYNPDGTVGFNAFAIISYDPATKAYVLHSYTGGRVGTFALVPTESGTTKGYYWEIPAGPAMIRYTATYDGATWREVGERIVPDKPAQRFFEMTLNRVGKTDWPAAGTLPPR